MKEGNKGPIVDSAFLEVAFKASSDVKKVGIRDSGNIELDYEISGKLLFCMYSVENHGDRKSGSDQPS